MQYMCQICRACNHFNANIFGAGRRTLIFPEALPSSHPFPFPVPPSFFALQFRTCCFFLLLFSGLAAGAILGPSPSVCVSPLGRRGDGGRKAPSCPPALSSAVFRGGAEGKQLFSPSYSPAQIVLQHPKKKYFGAEKQYIYKGPLLICETTRIKVPSAKGTKGKAKVSYIFP